MHAPLHEHTACAAGTSHGTPSADTVPYPTERSLSRAFGVPCAAVSGRATEIRFGQVFDRAQHATCNCNKQHGWVADREPSLQLHLKQSPKWCSTAAKEGGLAPVAHLVRLAPSRSSSRGQRAHICTGTALTRATSALYQDWARRCHICTSAESPLPTSGLRSSRLRRIQSGRRCPKSCARCCSSRSHTMFAVRRPQPSPARSLSSFATVSPGGCTCACAAQTCAHCPLLAFRGQAGFKPLLRHGG